MRILILVAMVFFWVSFPGGAVHAQPAPDPTPPPEAPPGTPLQQGESLPEPPPAFDNPPGLTQDTAPADEQELSPVEFADTVEYDDPVPVKEPLSGDTDSVGTEPGMLEDEPVHVDGSEEPELAEAGRAGEQPPHAGSDVDVPEDPYGDPDPGTARTDAKSGTSARGALQDAAQVIADEFPDLAGSVSVTVHRGLIQVDGTVPKLAQVLEIEERLGRLGDNKVIVNQLLVQPPSRPDAEIAEELAAAMEASEALGPHEISFQVREQQVFLSGWAPDLTTVRMAIAEAARIEGVAGVDIAAVRAH